jgi:protein ImuA
MTHLRIHRGPHRAVPLLKVTGEFALRPGRVHEICGPARRSLALRVAAKSSGPVLWLRPAWQVERLNPDGICHLVDPGRLIFADCRRTEDLLWCFEEALRAGAVTLAVAELPLPPALTPVRRLHLAAEAGAAAAGIAPLGLLLTPEGGGAVGVESCWQATGAHEPDHPGWRIDRLRARAQPPKSWHLGATGTLEPLTASTPVAPSHR